MITTQTFNRLLTFASAVILVLQFNCSVFTQVRDLHNNVEVDRLPREFSGIYPHLSMWNDGNECGTGAVVVWQNDLWMVTYSPHAPNGSDDKLYQVTPQLEQKVFTGSVGGTPANRMIHQRSEQLLIGPYLIDKEKQIRTLAPDKLFGRLTGNAIHLTNPDKVYYATMEEGLYEVDVNTLEVVCLIRDGNRNAPNSGVTSRLPGYHGKGLYSGQGRLIYSNNGEHGQEAARDPTIPSGALAQWFGEGDWQLVRRNQFTEVSGPGGIFGNANPNSDPIWALGWDEKSVILALLENRNWHFYRLPKGSHSYDGAHGWNTEWPRIREIGESDLLATMHGTFWRFPKSFSQNQSSGIAPRSNYLKVVGDFCRWNDKIILGCDDSARAEFLNSRAFKSKHTAARQSHSNLWFIDPEQLDQLGPAIGRGAVWLREDLKENVASDPFLFSGYDYRQLHLTHSTSQSVKFLLEVDQDGNNQWKKLTELVLEPGQSVSRSFDDDEKGAWIRLTPQSPAVGVTATFSYRNRDERTTQNDAIFEAVASPNTANPRVGLMRSLAHNKLGLVMTDRSGENSFGYYELDQDLNLARVDNTKAKKFFDELQQPSRTYSFDGASVVIEEEGKRYRLPFNQNYVANDSESQGIQGQARVCREIATERDLLNIHGTFYELPARNAQGLAKIRPIATHNLAIHDYCSHAGLLLLTGIKRDSSGHHIIQSRDGNAALWAGAFDDLWKLGKPRGNGGPFLDSEVKANIPSDPYLMTAYDRKSVTISSSEKSKIILEVDVDGTGLWIPYKTFAVEPGVSISHQFPIGFGAYWVRATSQTDAVVTVQFTYE